MAMLAVRFTCLFLVFGLGSVFGQTVPCDTTRDVCMRNGFSSLSIFNNQIRCCLPGYSMAMVNNNCQCTKTADAVLCSKGPDVCLNAPMRSWDGQGNMLCCPSNYPSMNSQSMMLNGMMFSSCTCSRSGGASNVQVISGNGQGTVVFGGNRNFNNYFQKWNQRFRQTMQNRMQALQDQLRAMRNRISVASNSWLQG